MLFHVVVVLTIFLQHIFCKLNMKHSVWYQDAGDPTNNSTDDRGNEDEDQTPTPPVEEEEFVENPGKVNCSQV